MHGVDDVHHAIVVRVGACQLPAVESSQPDRVLRNEHGVDDVGRAVHAAVALHEAVDGGRIAELVRRDEHDVLLVIFTG